MFQSTHPRRVWPYLLECSTNGNVFQSTHPRRVWPNKVAGMREHIAVSIHTPTKGVTSPSVHAAKTWTCFNPHTHEGCDTAPRKYKFPANSFNPHTHEGCDSIVAWSLLACPYKLIIKSNKRVWLDCCLVVVGADGVSIHTPTKGVTFFITYHLFVKVFQSTHPRRVWLHILQIAEYHDAKIIILRKMAK